MNKKVFTFIVFFALVANVSAQLEVSPSENVGIGTNSPQHKLHVVGSTYVTGNLYLGGTASNFLGTAGNVPVIFKVNNILAGFTGSSGNTNVSFGYEALLNRTGGAGNTAVGVEALHSVTTSNYHTAIGYRALYDNTEGVNNTATGYAALRYNTTGNYNTANGYVALYQYRG